MGAVSCETRVRPVRQPWRRTVSRPSAVKHERRREREAARTKDWLRPVKPRFTPITVLPLEQPRYVCGLCGPLVVGVMSDAPRGLRERWL